MYEDYFGLERPPFKITPDTSLFYEGGKRGDILAALVYAIHRGEGIIKVVGEVGSGKTMLCRMLQLKLPDTVEIVYIANPSVSADDILFVIAHELSIPGSKGASKHEVMHALQDYLLQRHMENKQVVLFVEEAQGMPLDTLEEIRLLSNLETDENKLLQIILFGQPELDQNLSVQSIRQLRERITHSFDLEPLTQDEIHNYLNFRMREVGYTGPELINSAVARKIEQYSEGLLRRINIIADKILLSAFAEGTHNLSSKHVTAAVNDSAFEVEAPRKSRIYWWLGLLAVIALVFTLYGTRSHWWSALATDLLPKSGIAAKSDKPITDIATPALETASDKAPIGADLEVDMKTYPEQPETLVPMQQEAVQVEQQIEQPVIQAEVQQVDVQQVVEVEQKAEGPTQLAEELTLVVEVEQQAEGPTQVAIAETISEEDVVLQSALDQAASSEELANQTSTNLSLTADYSKWLNAKLRESRDWLGRANRDGVSIQVLMRSKSAARELVYYLRNEWPLDLSQTYLYEVSTDNRSIYRVFYSEFDSLSVGRSQLDLLPESVKINSPYLHSVSRMQKALL